jgi:hypothetical protein
MLGAATELRPSNVIFADFARRHLLRLAILKATDRWDRALLVACAGDPDHEPDCPFCSRIVERIRAGFRG